MTIYTYYIYYLSGVNWEVKGGNATEDQDDSWEMKAISRINWDRERDVMADVVVGRDNINNDNDDEAAEANIYQLPTFRYLLRFRQLCLNTRSSKISKSNNTFSPPIRFV